MVALRFAPCQGSPHYFKEWKQKQRYEMDLSCANAYVEWEQQAIQVNETGSSLRRGN